MLLALLAAAEIGVAGSGSSRGETRAEVTMRAEGLAFGAAELEGAAAPRRTELLFGAEEDWFRGEVRVVPGTAGLFKIAGEAAAHFESLGLILSARSAGIGKYQLRAAGARIELEKEISGHFRAGASASAWALSLEAPKTKDPWSSYGRATLDWPESWEVGAWFESASMSLSGSPQGLQSRGAIGDEVAVGPVKLRAEAGLQRLFAQGLLLFDLTAGLAIKFE